MFKPKNPEVLVLKYAEQIEQSRASTFFNHAGRRAEEVLVGMGESSFGVGQSQFG